MEILIYLSLHTLNMGILKYLSLKGVPTETILVFRGAGCVLLAFLLAKKDKLSLVPKKMKLQLTRVLVAGLGLGLMIASYQYINASTVAVLFKFDVIFLIFLSLLERKKAQRMIVYGLGAFLLLFLHVQYFKQGSEDILGYALALGGTFIISIGFILLSKSGKSENQAVTCIVPGFSLFLAGSILGLLRQGSYLTISWENLMIGFLSGIVMFWIYIYTLKLYRKHSVVLTELLTFICIIIFIPIEIWGLRISFDLHHIISIMVIGLYTLFVYLKKERQHD